MASDRTGTSTHRNALKHGIRAIGSGLAAAGLLQGCLEGAGSYLRQDREVAAPRSLTLDTLDTTALRSQWTREQPLGLEGSVAATLLDPAVARAMLATEVAERRSAGTPDTMALQAWQRWFGGGRMLPLIVRWRFDRDFHAEAITDPAQWQMALIADDGSPQVPLRWSRVVRKDDDEAWGGTFTVWFPWRRADGRSVLGTLPRRLRFQVAGNPGRAELQWRFAPLLSDNRNVPWGLDPW